MLCNCPPSVTSSSLSGLDSCSLSNGLHRDRLLNDPVTDQAEQRLQHGSSVISALPPAIFASFSQWGLTSTQRMILLGLSNEKTRYNWKSQSEIAKLTRDILERTSYIPNPPTH